MHHRLSFIRLIFTVLALMALMTGCRKDKSEAPTIEFLKPFSSDPYHIGDSIHIRVAVHDDQNITGITVSLVNSSYTPVLPVQTFQAGKQDILIDFYYVITNKEIPTGTYAIQVFVTDGDGESRSYSGVYITELLRELNRVYLALQISPSLKKVYTLQPDSSPVFLMDLPGDFAGAAVSTRYERYFIAGKFAGDLVAVNTKNQTVSWMIPGIPSGGNPYFTCLSADKDLVYAGYYSGSISGYNYLKNQEFQTLTDANSFPKLVLPLENYFLALEEFYTGGGKNLLVYNYPAGNILHVTPVSMNVKALLPKNNDEVYVIGNQSGKGWVYTCRLSTGIMTWRQELGNDTISDACRVNESLLLFATGQGISEYNFNSNNMVPLVNGSGIQLIRYEEAGNEVYVAKGQMLERYGYLQHQLVLINNEMLPDSILHIDFLYNREKFN